MASDNKEIFKFILDNGGETNKNKENFINIKSNQNPFLDGNPCSNYDEKIIFYNSEEGLNEIIEWLYYLDEIVNAHHFIFWMTDNNIFYGKMYYMKYNNDENLD